MHVRIIVGLVLSATIAAIGIRTGSLTRSGAAAAVATGSIITARGGYGRAALLVGFFTGSSLLSRIGHDRGERQPGYAAKGGQRDHWQVLANGGVASVIAALGDGQRGSLAYLGSLAAVNGDTWATEAGRIARVQPRHIITWQLVPAGTSGAVSLPGTLASIAGGASIGVLARLTGVFDPAFRARTGTLLITGLVAGSIGSLVDSLVGATVQEQRWCSCCQQLTERAVHQCGEPTTVAGGVPGLNNDVVNLLCSLSGALIGALIERRIYRGSDACE